MASSTANDPTTKNGGDQDKEVVLADIGLIQDCRRFESLPTLFPYQDDADHGQEEVEEATEGALPTTMFERRQEKALPRHPCFKERYPSSILEEPGMVPAAKNLTQQNWNWLRLGSTTDPISVMPKNYDGGRPSRENQNCAGSEPTNLSISGGQHSNIHPGNHATVKDAKPAHLPNADIPLLAAATQLPVAASCQAVEEEKTCGKRASTDGDENPTPKRRKGSIPLALDDPSQTQPLGDGSGDKVDAINYDVSFAWNSFGGDGEDL